MPVGIGRVYKSGVYKVYKSRAPCHIYRNRWNCSGRRHKRPTSKTTSSFPSPGQASAGSSRDNPAMSVMSEPLDAIRAILIRYAAGDIGPPGADHEIMKILRTRGHVTNKRIKPMLVGIHRMNRGGAIGTSKGVRTLMDKIAVLHWNDDECRHAICVELTGFDRTDEDEFRTWCENAGSDFPAVPPGSLMFVSLACSRACLAGIDQ